MAWIEQMEYEENKMPRPDLVIYLYVPWEIGLELSQKQEIKNKRAGNEDIAERDINHRIQTEHTYSELSKSSKNWKKINCVDKNKKIRSVDSIHQDIIHTLANTKSSMI